MHFQAIYYEKDIFQYPLGQQLRDSFSDGEWIEIENHNHIPEMRAQPNSAFGQMKRNLIIGTRKTHKYVPNHKTSDFLVPYTSSGCTAACLYCYLVCNYNKCAYLRLFVNREQMMDKLIKTAQSSEKELTFEIGSNSDLVLENTFTGNLPWTVEQFTSQDRGRLTFPTKFSMVEPLLGLPHKGRVTVRMSVNPQELIRRIEFGTSPLIDRIRALNQLCGDGYPVGLLIAPVILADNWKALYTELLDTLEAELSEKAKATLFIEVIFMTYSYVHRKINEEAFPNAVELYDPSLMTGRGRGKYCYRPELRADGEEFLRCEIARRFPENQIVYVV